MRASRATVNVLALVLVLSLVSTTQTASLGATDLRMAAEPSRHLVRFESSDSVPGDLVQRVDALGGTVEVTYPSIGIATITGLTEATAATLAQAGDVGAIIPDAGVAGVEPAAVDAPVAADDTGLSPANPATASFYPRQWHLREAIRADKAWAAGYLGSPSVAVAILDTGIDYNHRDLAGRVDLARSKSFVPSDDALVAANFPGKHPVTDLHYHGTHVAATVSSNALVAAGVTSKVTLIGVKVLGANNRGTRSGVLAGLMYAADAGADVVNMSLGSPFDKDGAGQFVAMINRAVTYANRKGATVVVSAGNNAIDLDHDGNSYRAYCSSPTVICVAATGPTASTGTNGPWTNVDASAPYSNYGRSAISVAAPGGNQASVWAACSSTSLTFPTCRPGRSVLGLRGTSMAAPHATGLAALLRERLGRDPARIRAAIQQSADDLGQPGTDPNYGKGRVNVARALGLP